MKQSKVYQAVSKHLKFRGIETTTFGNMPILVSKKKKKSKPKENLLDFVICRSYFSEGWLHGEGIDRRHQDFVPHVHDIFWIHIYSLNHLVMVVIRVCIKTPLSHSCHLMSQWFKMELAVTSQVRNLSCGTIELQYLLFFSPQGDPVLLLWCLDPNVHNQENLLIL